MYLRTINSEFIENLHMGQEDLYAIWYAIKREREYFGEAYFPLKELHFETSLKYYLQYLLNYLKRLHDQPKETELSEYLSWMEQVPKLTWLLREWSTNNCKFEHPLGVHFEPAVDFGAPADPQYDEDPMRNMGVWRIHPGGTRQKVLYFFGEPRDQIKTLCFNTTGIKLPTDAKWTKIFETPAEFQEYFSSSYGVDAPIGLTPDRGTFIPHVIPSPKSDGKSNWDKGIEEHKKILERFKSINLVGVNFSDLQDNYISRRSHDAIDGGEVFITVQNPNDSRQIIRGILLALLDFATRKRIMSQLNIKDVKVEGA